MKKRLWNIVSAGRGRDTSLEVLRKVLLLNAMLIPGLVFTLILGVLAYTAGNTVLSIVDLVVCGFIIWLMFYTRKVNNLKLPLWLACWVLLVFYLFLAAQGGVENSAVVWVLSYPLAAIFLLASRKGFYMCLVMLAGFLSIFLLQNTFLVSGEYSLHFQIRLAAVYIVITLIALITEELRSRIHLRLQASNTEKEEAIQKLNRSLEEIRTLQGILPICLNCKKIRDDKGYWQAVEEYVQTRTHARFSHALCPDCLRELYPEYAEEQRKKDEGD
ncbi:MAG: hypothetical protein GF388_06065 [Candidatus Aegiribacteria sp.]|nr:hypothetical protein [Candidatus Aegiribacteria sp.]MBD3294738.1 hypothetical protein [Candidatus Fermentibacteria bacterium]